MNYIPDSYKTENNVALAKIFNINNLNIAIYLNDKYAFNAPSANGYVGILWSIVGLHDRTFVDYPLTGKIRRMTFNSMRKKYDLSYYLEKYKTN